MYKYLVFLACFLSSCASTVYYQVYKTKTDKGSVDSAGVSFDDKNCRVIYNLWSEGGNMSCRVFNKRDADLVIDLRRSFFVMNGQARALYRHTARAYTSNKVESSSSATVIEGVFSPRVAQNASSSVSGVTTTYTDDPEVRIPPNTSMEIEGSAVVSTRMTWCDVDEAPDEDEIKPLQYDKQTSPYTFYNLLTYAVAADTVRSEHRFYVSSITNFPKSMLKREVRTTPCGKTLEPSREIFVNTPPDGFFVKYDTVPKDE